MEAKQLRIGNYVKYSKYVEIISVHEDSIGFEGSDECGFSNIEEFKPIPLTEEWLVKFGFKLESNSFSKGDFHIEVSSSENNINFDYYPLSLPIVKLNYVHQLQNLYFALTGKELEIKE